MRRNAQAGIRAPAYGTSRVHYFGGALERFNTYGTAWVSGQLIRWLYERLTPRTRKEVDERRSGVLPRDAVHRERRIGMHIRRGDSCALGSRFCPRNKTATYYAAAAVLRARYSINKLVVATDDEEAAKLCTSGVMGFECSTMAMGRSRFSSTTSIERRVVHHASGELSGSAVALDALADVEMLADCDAHVLVLRSAVSRLALALSIARRGRFPPFISLQWPWGGLPGPVNNVWKR